MKKSYIIFRACLFLGFSIILIGALFKIMHWPGANIMILLGFLTSLVYMVIGIADAFDDPNNSTTEKVLWLLGFLMSSFIIGIVYYFLKIKPKVNSARFTKNLS